MRPLVAAMQQIADWLRRLGMPEYAERFAENDIDASALRYLTDQDLEKIGVSLGHRRKMLAAIAELPGAALVAPQPAATPERKSLDEAERRQLTVMFCNLVGSTALSARLDPEDLRGIIGAYHRCCTEVIERNGGFVPKYMGDGVLSYFRYPHAHEHDAERAVRAGLALVEAVPKLTTAAGMPLQVRIGIATGLVVVGDLIGSGEARERGIVGETPTSRHDCKGLPSRTQSSSPIARDDFSALSSSFRTSGRGSSRALSRRCDTGRRCDRVWWKAGLRLYTQVV
jgi:class 3 adenylate cyclase